MARKMQHRYELFSPGKVFCSRSQKRVYLKTSNITHIDDTCSYSIRPRPNPCNLPIAAAEAIHQHTFRGRPMSLRPNKISPDPHCDAI